MALRYREVGLATRTARAPSTLFRTPRPRTSVKTRHSSRPSAFRGGKPLTPAPVVGKVLVPRDMMHSTNQWHRVAEVHAAALSTVAPTVLSFTPQHALVGGVVLGAATVMKLLLTGRILGVSGAVKGLVQGDAAGWRVAFLCGMVAGGFMLSALAPGLLETLPASFPAWRAALSGLLVGFGAALGNGCTSGHGICGNARMSPRSMAFTAAFFVTAALTATLTHSLTALNVSTQTIAAFKPLAGAELNTAIQLGTGSLLALAAVVLMSRAASAAGAAAASVRSAAETAVEFVVGLTFALGLGVSGMTHASKVVGFLSMASPAWDPSLAFVMGSALLMAAVGFQGIVKLKVMVRPVLCRTFAIPTSTAVDIKLLAGGLIFGLGWGLSGLCPGPAITNMAVLTPQLVAYLTSMVSGMMLEKALMTAKKEAAAAH